MIVYRNEEDPQQWAKLRFGGADMTDIRRADRVIAVAEATARNPGAHIPEMFESKYEIKASYNLFKHQETTPDNLQAGH